MCESHFLDKEDVMTELVWVRKVCGALGALWMRKSGPPIFLLASVAFGLIGALVALWLRCGWACPLLLLVSGFGVIFCGTAWAGRILAE